MNEMKKNILLSYDIISNNSRQFSFVIMTVMSTDVSMWLSSCSSYTISENSSTHLIACSAFFAAAFI